MSKQELNGIISDVQLGLDTSDYIGGFLEESIKKLIEFARKMESEVEGYEDKISRVKNILENPFGDEYADQVYEIKWVLEEEVGRG